MADTNVTVQAVVDNSLARQKDSDENTWEDSELLKYINKARTFIYNLLILNQSDIGLSEGTITMVATTQEYDLSGNLDDFWCMQADGVYFSTIGTPLTPIAKTDAVRLLSATTDTPPTMFYLTGTKLGVANIPTATAVSADATLNCRFYSYQSDLTLTDNMPWKNLFNEAIGFFVDSMAFARNEVDSQVVSSIYNTLEDMAIKIINARSGKGVVV